MSYTCSTEEPVLKDHLIGLKNVVCQDRWSLVTGSVILKYRSFCQKWVVCRQDRFHCILKPCYYHVLHM